jgi:hypothetical protein
MSDELVVDMKGAPGDSSSGSGSSMAPIVVPVFAAGLLAKLVSPKAGLAALGVGLVVAVSRALRTPRQGRFVLGVDSGALTVRRERSPEAARIPLVDLLDVTLDRTKPSSGRGGAVERVRLSLERRAPLDAIHVPEEPTTALEAQEWLAKVRVFLRRHGWVPADERPLE